MRPLAATLLFPTLLFAASFAGAEPDTSTITGSFVPPKPLARVNPLYPNGSRYEGRGGWVRMAFCVDTTGAVADVTVVDSSRAGEFEDNAVAAMQKWKYQPAQFGGAAIRQCGNEVMFSFELEGKNGARELYLKRWKSISALITENRLAEAEVKIDALDVMSNYEEARLMILHSFIARAQNNIQGELDDLTTALIWRDQLEPELVTALLHRSLVLNVQLQQMAAAHTCYTKLTEEQADTLTEEERRFGDKLLAVVDSDASLATPGSIRRRTPTDKARPSWSARLLRPAFQFEAVDGELNRVDVRCNDHSYTSPFSADQVWRVPASWGACDVVVFGTEGTTFKLVEFAKS